MKIRKTSRGFSISEFFDRYKHKCSIQKSSLASEDAIWIGVDYADPQIMAKDTPGGGTGWVKFDIPSNVELYTRMHLTRKMVFRLLPHLIKFWLTGNI